MIYKSHLLKLKQACQSVNLCVYILDHGKQIAIGLKSLTFLKDLQDHNSMLHLGSVGTFLCMAWKYCFCSGMVGQMDYCNVVFPAITIIFIPITFFWKNSSHH